MREWTKSNETKWKSQTQCRKALNPRGWVSRILPCSSGAPMRKCGDSILLSTVSRQVALATTPQDIGWKLKILIFLSVLGFHEFHQPTRSMTIACFAKISSHLMSSGCFNGTHCQWWSSLFSIGQLVWEEDGSLSKTTKLLLLDSLLQEVCIESGSDGSLALSSLGLSVCLVSHNLLYSGLKKAHSKMESMKKNKQCLVWSSCQL